MIRSDHCFIHSRTAIRDLCHASANHVTELQSYLSFQCSHLFLIHSEAQWRSGWYIWCRIYIRSAASCLFFLVWVNMLIPLFSFDLQLSKQKAHMLRGVVYQRCRLSLALKNVNELEICWFDFMWCAFWMQNEHRSWQTSVLMHRIKTLWSV